MLNAKYSDFTFEGKIQCKSLAAGGLEQLLEAVSGGAPTDHCTGQFSELTNKLTN